MGTHTQCPPPFAPPRSQPRHRAMWPPWLLLLALPAPPPAPRGLRCPGGVPPVPPPTQGRNETLGGGSGGGRGRGPDVAVLVAVGGWLGALLAYVGRFVRRSRAQTRLHLEYLGGLPHGPPGPEEEGEEEETPSAVLCGHQSAPAANWGAPRG